jgi:hypothetical protein
MSFSKEEKTMWLEDWKQSGKKAWTYAKENGLIPQTFCRWVKLETENVCGFVEIPAYKKPRPEQEQKILIEKGDIKIHVPLSVMIEYPGIIMESLKVTL